MCIVFIFLTLLDTGITISLADVSGSWNIIGFDADSMSLTQVGSHVYGTYNTHQGQGTIDGIIDARNVWTGTWNEPFDDALGYFSVTFSNDSSHLDGSWMYGYPDCDIYPEFERYGPCNYYDSYYSSCYGDWDGYFQGEKVVAGNMTKGA